MGEVATSRMVVALNKVGLWGFRGPGPSPGRPRARVQGASALSASLDDVPLQ